MSSISAVIEFKSDVVRRAMDQRGGWEGWLQVELADVLKTEEENEFFGYKIEREINVFPDSSDKKIDLWFTPQDWFDSAWPYVGVELKTYSKGQDEAKSFLSKRFVDDVDKCAGGVNTAKLRSEERKVIFLCVGVTPDPKDLVRLNKEEEKNSLEARGFTELDTVSALSGNHRDQKPLKVVWTWTIFPREDNSEAGNSDDDDGGGPGMDEDENEEDTDDAMNGSGGPRGSGGSEGSGGAGGSGGSKANRMSSASVDDPMNGSGGSRGSKAKKVSSKREKKANQKAVALAIHTKKKKTGKTTDEGTEPSGKTKSKPAKGKVRGS